MTRPIDADDLLSLYENADTLNVDAYKVPVPVVRQNIIDAPTLDYAPVRHGEWLIDDNIFTKQRKCSLCGHNDNPKTAIWGRYCWYCGALMDKGEQIK